MVTLAHTEALVELAYDEAFLCKSSWEISGCTLERFSKGTMAGRGFDCRDESDISHVISGPIDSDPNMSDT